MLDCGHACRELCNVNPCECECGARVYRAIDLDPTEPSLQNTSEQIVSLNAPKGPPLPPAPRSRRRHRAPRHTLRRSPERPLRIAQEVQAFQDFANGGHRLSDALIEEKQRRQLEEMQEQSRRSLDSAKANPLQKREVPTATNILGDLLGLGDEEEEEPGRKVRRSVWTPPQAAQTTNADQQQNGESFAETSNIGNLLDLGDEEEEEPGRKVRRSVWTPPQAAQTTNTDPQQNGECLAAISNIGDLLDLGDEEEDIDRAVGRSAWTPPQAAQTTMASIDAEVERSLLD